MESSHEQHLLREIRAGRREACAELVRAHYAAVYRFCVHLSGDAEIAEDLTQDTFAKLWVSIGGFRGESSLTTWLYRIAHRQWLDNRRRLEQGRAVLDRVGGKSSEPVSELACPLRGLIVEEEAKRLYEAVQRLTQNYRLVIMLHYFQGLGYREIAAVLGESSGTVRIRAWRALRQLRALLSDEASYERTPRLDRVDEAGGPAARPAAADGSAGA